MATEQRRFDLPLPRKRVHQIVGLVLLIGLWEVYGRVSTFLIPPFSETVVALVDLFASGVIYGPLSDTLQQFVIGYALAVAVAFPIGIAMGASRFAEYTLDPFVNVMFVTSISSLLPLLIIVFGTGFTFRVMVVFLFGVFHMILNFQSGVKNIDSSYVDAAKVFGSNTPQLYRHVLLPAALPFIIAGLRLGIGRSVKGMVVAELWILAGVGGLLRSYQHQLSTAYVLAVVLVLMAIGVGFVRLLYVAEMRVAPWRAEVSE